MKVKIFQSYYNDKLTTTLNEFIADKKVIDIKLSTAAAPNDNYIQYIVLVQYEE